MAWIGKVERPTQMSWSSSANHCKHPVCLMCTSQRIAPSCFSGLGHMQALKRTEGRLRTSLADTSSHLDTFGTNMFKKNTQRSKWLPVCWDLTFQAPWSPYLFFNLWHTHFDATGVTNKTTDRRLYPSRRCSHSAHFPQLTSQSTMASNKKTPRILIQWWKKSCTWDV